MKFPIPQYYIFAHLYWTQGIYPNRWAKIIIPNLPDDLLHRANRGELCHFDSTQRSFFIWNNFVRYGFVEIFNRMIDNEDGFVGELMNQLFE